MYESQHYEYFYLHTSNVCIYSRMFAHTFTYTHIHYLQAKKAMDKYLTNLQHYFVTRAWQQWKEYHTEDFFSPLLRQVKKYCTT